MRQRFYFTLLAALCITSPAATCSRWRSNEKKHQARLSTLRTMLVEHVPQAIVKLITQFAHPFLKTQLATNSQRPTKVFFTPDSKKIVTILKGSQARGEKICVWDVYTGQCLCTFVEHKSPISLHATSPDGQLIATVSKEACYVWQLKNGQIKDSIQLIGTHKPIVSLSLDEKSQILAYTVAITPRQVRIRNLESRKESTLNLENRVYSLTFNAENQLMARTHRGGTQFWDVSTKKRKATVKKGFVRSSPDRTLYGVTRNHTPCPTEIYSSSEHSLMQTLDDCEPKCYWQVTFSHDNRNVLTLSHNSHITIWKLHNGVYTRSLQHKRHTPGLLYKTAQFTSEDNVVILTGERAIFLSNLKEGQQTLVGDRQTINEPKKMCSPDGTIIACEQRSFDDTKGRQFALHLFDVLHIVRAMELKRTIGRRSKSTVRKQMPTLSQ